MKICPLEAKLFHVDRRTHGQTVVMKLIVTFHNVVNMLKKWSFTKN